MTFLEKVGIDITNCFGQSYDNDNASNMSTTYHGVQAIIKARNSYAEYILCFAHSLNLAENEAANCIPQVSSFFDIIDKLYTLMRALTHRWSVLKDNLKSTPVLKSLSETRWSARAGMSNLFTVRAINSFQNQLEGHKHKIPKIKIIKFEVFI